MSRRPLRVKGQPRAGPPPPEPEPPGPPYICEKCGRDKAVEKTFHCSLCTKFYCVQHLAPMAHDCFGALGKPQYIGVFG